MVTKTKQPPITQAAVTRFHEILNETSTAQATHEQLIRQQQALDLHQSGRLYSYTLRPRLISSEDHTRLSAVSSLLAGAMQRLAGHARYEGELGDYVRNILALTPAEIALMAMAPPTDTTVTHSRLDGFFNTDQLSVVEYNCHPSAGLFIQDALAEIYANTPAMKAFRSEYDLDTFVTRYRINATLTDAWLTGGMPGDGPQIAIVESGPGRWADLNLLEAELRRQGLSAPIYSADDLCYQPEQGLYARDEHGKRRPITMVYRRAVLTDLLSRYGASFTEHPLVQAWAAGACVVVNSFTTHLSHKKSALELLTDPLLNQLLSPEAKNAVEQHVPWTRLLRPGHTTYQGQQVELIPFAHAQREQLVLKPNDDYGGKGIVCGWESDDKTWRAALEQAKNTPHIIQERVRLPEVSYPTWTNGQLHMGTYYESTDPFLFDYTPHGYVCRLSQTSLINVATGGSVAPVFQVHQR